MNAVRAKVLMVGPWSPSGGGVATFMRNVVSSRLREKYDFIPFTTLRPGKRNIKGDNYGYTAMFRGGLKRVVQGMLITLWHLLKFPWIVAWHRPAVIQVQASDFQAFWEASLYVLMGKILRRPILLRIGGSFNRFWESSGEIAQAAIRWVLRQPSLLVLQSEYWSHYVSGLGRTAPALILSNFVPDGLVEQRASQTRAIPRFLLCCGEAPKLKGAYVLLEAVRELIGGGVPAEVAVMASPLALRDEIRNSGLGRHVKALDFLPHSEALTELRHTDVFLQISSSEGFPNALLEAMALGCACIVTPVGAVPEVVGADGECAFIVPVGDAVMLAERMRRLAADHVLRCRMASAAQARIRERYTEQSVVEALDHAYQFVLCGDASLSRVEEFGAFPFDR